VAKVAVARAARADLIEILWTSFDRWGEDGKARYESLLEAAIQELAADPACPMSKDRSELAPRLRSFHVRHVGRDHGVKAPVHVIYYRRARSSVVIVRVLHERMEPGMHLTATTRRGRRRRRT
jgi:toxin ParE1/3/4